MRLPKAWHCAFLFVANVVALPQTGPIYDGPAPVVKLDYGSFKGGHDPVTHSWNYLGMPFSDAGRFENPRLTTRKLQGVQDATQFGAACPQQSIGSTFAPSDFGAGAAAGAIQAALFPFTGPQSEDCLTINVQVPENTKPNAKLPVMMWIHGGGFQIGAPYSVFGETVGAPGAGINYRPGGLVKTSVELNQPIIVVSANYRLNAFGFSASKEMEAAGLMNIGIKDQRVAMEWVQKYISKFGGDPKQFTIMGESAGAWSVATHLVWDGGNTQGLFRAAMPLSGGPVASEGAERQQPVFDRMVARAGCSKAQDKIKCLRKAKFSDLQAAVNSEPYLLGYHSLQETWTVRKDGDHLPDSPHILAAQGKIANVPVLTGDMRDEGSLFCQIAPLNTTTEDQVKQYFNNVWFPKATKKEINELTRLYPQDPTKGSPYDTGLLNNPTPQYKRITSIVGDYSFESARRNFLFNHKGPHWNHLTEIDAPSGGVLPNNPLTKIPVLGSFHAADVFIYLFASIPREISKNVENRQATAISFVRTMNPNNHGLQGIPRWPQWTNSTRSTMRFLESGPVLMKDNYREEQIAYLISRQKNFLI